MGNIRENLCLQHYFGRTVFYPYFKRLEKEISRHLVCFIDTKYKILRSFLTSTLLFGAVFVPTHAVQASFLSSLFGVQASAETSTNTVKIPESNNNSQTIGLLQANISSISILEDSKGKQASNGAGKNDELNPTLTPQIVSENAILPATGPLGVYDGTDPIDPSLQETSVYVVRKGDSISQIADMFGVSINTILWANDMKKGDKLKEGDVLLILPVSGLEHTVTKGQTLQSIAKLYKADIADITDYNGLDLKTKLAVGDKLIIPDGEMFDEGGDKPVANLKEKEVTDKNYYATSLLKNIIGYFLNPVPTGRKTQGLHGPGNRGIDIGAPTGTNIYAAASGTVLKVVTGCVVGPKRCGGGYGNMAIVQHANGTKTLYAHMSKVNTNVGAEVAQGQVIGLVGNTGRSTGPHIHFEVFNAKNPGVDWSWAK